MEDKQATTIRLPKALYELLRRDSFENRRSQQDIIESALAERYGVTEVASKVKRYDVELVGPSTDNDDEQKLHITYTEVVAMLRGLDDGDDLVVHCTVMSDDEI